VSESENARDGEAIGYKKPPTSTRFAKGCSGNPKGRPKGQHKQLPYDTVLGQMVTVREEGRERRITAAEAFLLQLTRKGLAGDSAAARASLNAIETARAASAMPDDGPVVLRILFVGMTAGLAMRKLGLGIKKYPLDQARVRWELRPWIVEAALARRGTEALTAEEQREVWHATHKPEKVNWPEWWSYRG
jgi:hypothetical protein